MTKILEDFGDGKAGWPMIGTKRKGNSTFSKQMNLSTKHLFSFFFNKAFVEFPLWLSGNESD